MRWWSPIITESTLIDWSSASSGTRSFDLPGVQIHEIATIVFVSTNIEGDLDRISLREPVSERGLLFNTLKLDCLWVFSVFDFNDKLSLGESARKGLDFVNHLDGAFQFKTLGHTEKCF